MLGVGRDGPLGPSRAVAAAAGAATTEGGGGVLPAPITERDAWIALACAHGIGPVSFERLVERIGGARGVHEP
jgi:hypothetical protein